MDIEELNNAYQYLESLDTEHLRRAFKMVAADLEPAEAAAGTVGPVARSTNGGSVPVVGEAGTNGGPSPQSIEQLNQAYLYLEGLGPEQLRRALRMVAADVSSGDAAPSVARPGVPSTNGGSPPAVVEAGANQGFALPSGARPRSRAVVWALPALAGILVLVVLGLVLASTVFRERGAPSVIPPTSSQQAGNATPRPTEAAPTAAGAQAQVTPTAQGAGSTATPAATATPGLVGVAAPPVATAPAAAAGVAAPPAATAIAGPTGPGATSPNIPPSYESSKIAGAAK